MDGIEVGEGRLMLKRRPDGGGVDQQDSDRRHLTATHVHLQPIDDLARYRALSLLARFRVDPQLAVALGALVFGGGR